mmetsp:Transcript_19577/g.25342  ORF Transcript_19577/g.25342 Transcript_19577/m.25342 type:complete len:157 (-) Transcript_19577:192-662(-)
MVHPRRFGLKYSPPTLIIEYTDSDNDLKHYKIQLRKLDKQMSAETIAYKLCARYPAYLDPSIVKTRQVTRLIERLLLHFESLAEESKESQIESSGGISNTNEKEIDLNTVSEFQLGQAKAAMDVDFSKHLISRQDADYVYDKQQEFDDAVEDSGWD